MIKFSALNVILLLFSACLIGLLIYTWTSGSYFSFQVFWSYFKTSSLITSKMDYFNSLNIFKDAIKDLMNFNIIGFNMQTGNTVLKILKVMVNFFPYLGTLISFPIRIIMAVGVLGVNVLTYLVLIVETLLNGFINSWVPFGTGGFIQPYDWYYSMIIPSISCI